MVQSRHGIRNRGSQRASFHFDCKIDQHGMLPVRPSSGRLVTNRPGQTSQIVTTLNRLPLHCSLITLTSVHESRKAHTDYRQVCHTRVKGFATTKTAERIQKCSAITYMNSASCQSKRGSGVPPDLFVKGASNKWRGSITPSLIKLPARRLHSRVCPERCFSGFKSSHAL